MAAPSGKDYCISQNCQIAEKQSRSRFPVIGFSPPRNSSSIQGLGIFHIWINSFRRAHPQDVVVLQLWIQGLNDYRFCEYPIRFSFETALRYVGDICILNDGHHWEPAHRRSGALAHALVRQSRFHILISIDLVLTFTLCFYLYLCPYLYLCLCPYLYHGHRKYRCHASGHGIPLIRV